MTPNKKVIAFVVSFVIFTAIGINFNKSERQTKNVEWIEFLMENSSQSANKKLGSEEASLMLSQNCNRVSPGIYKELQRYTLDYSYQNEKGETFWHLCQKSMVWGTLVAQLKAANVSTEVANKEGKTPWLVAVENDNTTIAKWFKDNGANTAALDLAGNPAWFLAGPSTHDALRLWGLDKVDARNYAGQNDFIYALSNQKKERSKKLFEEGSDLSIRDHRKKTALHYAASTGNVELTRAIVKRNPEHMYAEDSRRGKPIDVASSSTRAILQEYGDASGRESQ